MRRGDELEVRFPSSSTDSLKLLGAGRADVAVVDIHDLGLARQAGRDLVGIGALVQRPLAAVIAREEIRRPRDLESRRVGVTGLASDDAVLRAVVEADGGDFERVDRVTIGFSAVPSLIAGRVGAVVSFWNVEGVALRKRGVRTREFRVDEYGAPRYPEWCWLPKGDVTARSERLGRAVVRWLRARAQALADRGATVADLVEASGADEALVRAQLAAISSGLAAADSAQSERLTGWAVRCSFRDLERAPDVRRVFPP